MLGMEDVFNARIASSRARTWSSWVNKAVFRPSSLARRLDYELDAGQLVQVGAHVEVGAGLVGHVRVHSPAADGGSRRRVDAGATTTGGVGVGLMHDDAAARAGELLRDARAHQAAADDAHERIGHDRTPEVREWRAARGPRPPRRT